MFLLHTVNLLLAVALLFWPLWFARRHLHLQGLDPLTVTMVLGLPIQVMRLFGGPLLLIEGGLQDVAYQYALAMGNLQVLMQTAGLVFFFRLFKAARIESLVPGQATTLGRISLRRGADLFLVAFLLFFYLLASSEFGLLNWLQNPRLGYQLYRVGQGHWYALAITSLSTSFLLRFLSAPRATPLMAWSAIYLGLSLLFGSKGVMLAFFTSLLIFLWLMRWRHLGKLFLFGVPVVFMFMVANLYLALLEEFDLLSVVEYFDYYRNAADYYRGVLAGEIPLFWGEVTATSYWAYVPRAVWPDKPFVYGQVLVNEIFFPGQAELTNTPDFGGAVGDYADFGVVGVIVFGFFSVKSIALAALAYLIFRRPGVNLNRVTLATVALMLMQFAPMFGQYFPGILLIAVLAAVMLAILAFRASRRRRWGAHPARLT